MKQEVGAYFRDGIPYPTTPSNNFSTNALNNTIDLNYYTQKRLFNDMKVVNLTSKQAKWL